MLLAGGGLDLMFVRKETQTHNLRANLYFRNPRKDFIGSGDNCLQQRCDYYKQTLQTRCFFMSENERAPQSPTWTTRFHGGVGGEHSETSAWAHTVLRFALACHTQKLH